MGYEQHPSLKPTFDPDGQYILWLESDDGSALQRELVEHRLQLDNTAPSIAPYPDGLQVRLMDGETVIPACGEIVDASEFQVWAQFEDEHYWYFTLSLYGGNPPASWSASSNYYAADDGTAGIKNTSETGMIPAGQPVHPRDVDMTVLG